LETEQVVVTVQLLTLNTIFVKIIVLFINIYI
jgi:hypothetical protein